MNGKFIVYALIVSFVCTISSWGALLDGSGGSGPSSRSGSSWSSNTGSGGGSWGGGGHK